MGGEEGASRIVLPGDVVFGLAAQAQNKVLRLGSGLSQDADRVVAIKAGRLNHAKSKLWVEGSQKRYIPSAEDSVIGIVIDRRAEEFLVDLNAPVLGLLPILSFEGATRKNIPNLKEGAVVYGRVVKAHRDISPALSCLDASGKGSGYGPLKEGYLFECSTGLARSLLGTPTYPVLEALGKSLAFEIAVGVNGRVWVKSDAPATTVLVSNAIINSECLSAAQQHILVQKLLQAAK
ncbi:putative exosome complex component rrp40 [Selaginella moellendorffii]|nr:putative exosome complex component rrp40 [Selaginella moellendorffii]|eukprot:XP_002963728.2 putative exosome complex component rrp40 [Selaginella moellendorffii]